MNRGKKAERAGRSETGARAPRQTGVALSPELQAHIGRNLKVLYDGIVNEPVPPRFLELLNKLEEAEAEKAATTGTRREPGR